MFLIKRTRMLTYNLGLKKTYFFVIVWKWLVSMVLAARGKKKLEKSVKSRDQIDLKFLIYKDYFYLLTFLLLFFSFRKVIILKDILDPIYRGSQVV